MTVTITGDTYYHIVIEDSDTKVVRYITDSNIQKHEPTSHRGKARVYYSLSGAKQALNAVNKRIGGSLSARIESFHAVLEF